MPFVIFIKTQTTIDACSAMAAGQLPGTPDIGGNEIDPLLRRIE